jgi:purine-binding chemotaxis protein CheW
MSIPTNSLTEKIFLFTLDEQSYAIPLIAVLKVIPSIEIRFLPEAPEIISGIINLKGQIIPVVDIRIRFGLCVHEIDLDDRIIIADTGKRKVAIPVDSVKGIIDLIPGQMMSSTEILPFAKHLRSIAKTGDDLILIYDLEKFISLDEEKELDRALKTNNK